VQLPILLLLNVTEPHVWPAPALKPLSTHNHQRAASLLAARTLDFWLGLLEQPLLSWYLQGALVQARQLQSKRHVGGREDVKNSMHSCIDTLSKEAQRTSQAKKKPLGSGRMKQTIMPHASRQGPLHR